MNTGVVAQITMSVQPAFDAFEKNSLKDLPIASSTLNISAENLSTKLISISKNNCNIDIPIENPSHRRRLKKAHRTPKHRTRHTLMQMLTRLNRTVNPH